MNTAPPLRISLTQCFIKQKHLSRQGSQFAHTTQRSLKLFFPGLIRPGPQEIIVHFEVLIYLNLFLNRFAFRMISKLLKRLILQFTSHFSHSFFAYSDLFRLQTLLIPELILMGYINNHIASYICKVNSCKLLIGTDINNSILPNNLNRYLCLSRK